MKTVEYYGTYPPHDPDNITWWESLLLADMVAEKRGHSVIVRTKTTHDDPSDIDKPEAKFYGPLQINDKVDGNPKRKIIVFRGDQNDVYTGEDIEADLHPETGILTIHKHPMNNLAQYPAGGHQGWKRA